MGELLEDGVLGVGVLGGRVVTSAHVHGPQIATSRDQGRGFRNALRPERRRQSWRSTESAACLRLMT